MNPPSRAGTFQLFEVAGGWLGDADTLPDARRAAEVLVAEEYGEIVIELDGREMERLWLNEHGERVWRTSDLVRTHDGRA